MKNKTKKVTLDDYEAAHALEWYLGLVHSNPDIAHCGECLHVYKKLSKCIGENWVKRIKYLLKKNPYSPLKKAKKKR